MKPSLQLRVSQQLTMTPQLQQAIRLLQLSSLELKDEIQEALESNPMLEADEHQDPGDQASDPLSHSGTHEGSDPSQHLSSEQDTSRQLESDAIPNDLPVDSAWDDIYQPTQSTLSSGHFNDDERDFESYNSKTESLQDHLHWQLNLTPFSETDRAIAHIIVEATNDDGYLTATVEDIVESINDESVEFEEVEAVLHRLQHFDPIGVCARNLKECLSLQLIQVVADQEIKACAQKIIQEHIEKLASRDFTFLKRKLKYSAEVLSSAVTLIRSLDPKPGRQITPSEAQYIVPDLRVCKQQGRWVIELNADVTPKIRINPNYAALVKRADTSSDSTFIKNHLQEARWFLKSLQSRNETLLKVATKIMEFQRNFLEYGDEAMKPLVLHDIADAVSMHESTISRVTTNKFIHTPRGIFELKYFFSSHVNTAEGGECSATAIRALIKKLVANENKQKPLSDNKIADILKSQGINVARRTIAKYREALRIPPSNERKQLP